MSKERPILFSAEMVRAILAGNKTQTRRVIKPQPDEDVTALNPRTTYAGNVLWSNVLWTTPKYGKIIEVDDRRCPYGKAGDTLWVRETYCPVNDTALDDEGGKWVDYRATPRYAASHPAGWDNDPDSSDALKWKPSIFMPRWASRITLEIIGVRAERLQEISEADAIAEGLAQWVSPEGKVSYGINRADVWEQDPRLTYKRLWDSINGDKHPWANNDWTWVVEFKLRLQHN